jgi:5-methylcytosine-specific restriction endonuclease McrA
MGNLNKQVLVLNRNWQPVNVTEAFPAICKFYQDKAVAVDSDYALYDFDSWIQSWSDASRLAAIDEDRVVSCARFNLVIPEIIRLNDYSGFRRRTVRFSRKNIFERDHRTCQYCGRKFSPKNLNIDHVIPRSRGGSSTWENVVLSCIPCNQYKADRTPAEAGMRLLSRPVAPQPAAFEAKRFGRCPKSWEDFLGKLYWDAELEP